MSDSVLIIGAVIGVFLFIEYHKIFRVFYFGKVGPHIFGELLLSWFFGCVIASGLVKLGGSIIEIVLQIAVYAFMVLMTIYHICLFIYKRKKKKAACQIESEAPVQSADADVPKELGIMERSIKWRKEHKGVSFLVFSAYYIFLLLFIVIRFE